MSEVPSTTGTGGILQEDIAFGFVIGGSLFGILWGLVNALLVRKVDMEDYTHLRKDSGEGEEKGLLNAETSANEGKELLKQMKHISKLIEQGAITFLRQEYTFLAGFLILFGILLFFAAEHQFGQAYTTIAFLIGGITSIISGYIGMRIAVYTNVRTTKECCEDIAKGFQVAYRGGQVLGFVLVGLALFVLQILIIVYQKIYDPNSRDTQLEKEMAARELFEMIAGYGLGGSTVALFGRVGGGIYTKAADVGSDLAGKVVQGLEEDDPSNPGVIADNVGDNVGDIAGMGADLFGSLAEATCAALVIAATSPELLGHTNAMYFPLMVTAVGIFVSFITSFFATNIQKATPDNVEGLVKWQLIISTILMTGAIYPLIYVLPDTFKIGGVWKDENDQSQGYKTEPVYSKPIYAYGCILCGLWSGFIIGWITEIYTSNAYSPVQDLAEACRMGAAPNIILGLALGYMSTIIPVLCVAITIYVAFTLAGMYGIALSALGMLGCLPIALAIDGYGPISDNAGGIAEMSGLHPQVRKYTDKLDAAGNTTAAIGKGFAIGSACLVSLALFGAYVTKANIDSVNILRPLEFSGLLIGAMLPYAFSALTMAAVGNAAKEMIQEIKRQFQNEAIRTRQEKPDYERCIAISTRASLRKMILPGLLVIGSPLVVGTFFGKDAVSGLLAGIIVSGIQIAFSFSNTGGAWDNAKKYIEAGMHISKEKLGDEDAEGKYVFKKHSEAHKAAVTGDTVGDPLKDTSGPSINILVKLSAITSLIFAQFFSEHGGIITSS